MSPALVEQPFEVAGLGPLQVGKAKTFAASGATSPTLPKGKQWGLPAGLYTPKQIVEANAPLLETCIHHLGPSPPGDPSAREQLIDNLASNLDLNTREASISIPTGDPSRKELAQQAVKIGKTLIKYVRNVTDVEYDPQYVVRSPCEGHLLKPHVSYLMFGPRSLRHLMQIYNEYLHQMVLLRDALLPFENYEEVLIPIVSGPKRGLRYTEDTRASFLTEALTKQVKQRTLLKTAQAFLAPNLTSQSDVGFQYTAGTVLPAFIAGGRSSRLLRYVPAVLDESVKEATFHYELPDYYDSDHIELEFREQDMDSTAEIARGASISTLFATGSGPVRRLNLNMHWPDDNTTLDVDLGQVARGRRYAYWVHGKGAPEQQQDEKVDPTQIFVHSAHAVLTQRKSKGLVLPPKGTHVIKSNNTMETLALLGILYPDNIVVVEEGQSIAQALLAGKGGFPDAGRFVISVNEP